MPLNLKRNAVTCHKRKYNQLSLKRREIEFLLSHPVQLQALNCQRNLTEFVKEFWPEVDTSELIWNWHLDYLCERLSYVAERVSLGLPRENDLIINIPPGTTKSKLVNVIFPVWCWTKWYWMRFISASYAASLSLEHAETSRDLVRSEKFQTFYPDLSIKRDKDVKSNFRIIKRMSNGTIALGGSRYSTSVGGTVTGFHGHILLVDDPLNPQESVSDVKLKTANDWMGKTLSMRKVDKAVTATILIMQRLHQNDPTGDMLKKKTNIEHISIPGEIRTEAGDRSFREFVQPAELIDRYVDGLMDPVRMPWTVMKDMQADLGQYGYAGQVGQNPVPPGGGMFKIQNFRFLDAFPNPSNISMSLRFWDKAGSDGQGAYTVGVKMHRLTSGKFLISDVSRGQWASEEREALIKSTAEADGRNIVVWHEQEPGSGGKDSAEATTRNLAGFSVHHEPASGDKVWRADPFSVQVNNGNVFLLTGAWNKEYLEELENFPFSTYKDQVDASSGAFNKLAGKRIAGKLGR